MKKLTFAVLGMGNRGTQYTANILKYPEQAQVVAMADNRRIRLDSANKYVNLPENMLFDSAEALLAQPKLADMMIIATQDAQHKDHAIRAMELGYDLLLEKPISNKLEEISQINAVAQKLGRKVFVCHVLRYTQFYKQIKKLLDQGVVGKIETVDASEHVGYYHIAHSYVRGNWHKEADSSPMILAKSSHDMDILLWLIGKDCQKVNSFGSLDYFTSENMPQGAAERCKDCQLDCPFNAQKFYISRIPGWPANILNPEPTEENIRKALDETDYGKCVFRMDNDVVDHQTCNFLFEGGVTATFQMTGFNNKQTRHIRIMGTEGEIWGCMADKKVYWQRYGQERQEIDLTTLSTNFSGHGGGDQGLIHDVIRYMCGEEFDTSSITFIDRSVQSHYLAFCAEASRLQDGKTLDFAEFKASICK